LHAVPQQTLLTQNPSLQSAAVEHVAPVWSLKAAVTVAAAVTLIVQVVPLVVVHPVQDEKTPVAEGDAASTTVVP
jgi:hypothetical protein